MLPPYHHGMTANISGGTPDNTSPSEDTPSPEEVLDSLARAIHEGDDWQMVLE